MKAPNYIIKQAREAKGLSQRDFAKLAGVAPTTILKCERGGSITPKTWAKVKAALGITEKPIDNGEYLIMF